MSHRLETGRVVGGRYRLDSLLARGGMAEVWEATDQTLTRPVAVKVLHPHLADDEAFRRRFRAEAVAVARLTHPNIVAIYDTCRDDGADAIVMELIQGRTLRDYLDDRGRLEPVEVVHIGSEVASGLACAHGQGVIHRDVKPANIMLSDDGRVLITDFGIAKMLDSVDVTRTSTLLGTVKYLAPEQVEGADVDGRTDVYALGAVLYECLCGRPPFERDSPSATALARLTSDPEPASRRTNGASAALDPVLARALARAPADRFPTALDLRSALVATPSSGPGDDATVVVDRHDRGDSEGDGARSGPHDGHTAPTPTSPRHRRPTGSIIAALLIVAALVAIALLIATTGVGRELLGGSAETPPAAARASGPIAVADIRSYDPEGSGPPGENEGAGGNVIDGLASTSWNSETYSSRRFGNLKRGVGLVLTLPNPATLEHVSIDSPVQDWSAEIYVADTAPPTLEGWGPVRAAPEAVNGAVRVDLGGSRGSRVLVWFTDLGAGPTYRMTVRDITLGG